MCLFEYVNTEVKIILHLLLMSDLHAFANISVAEIDTKACIAFQLVESIF